MNAVVDLLLGCQPANQPASPASHRVAAAEVIPFALLWLIMLPEAEADTIATTTWSIANNAGVESRLRMDVILAHYCIVISNCVRICEYYVSCIMTNTYIHMYLICVLAHIEIHTNFFYK